MKSFYVFQFQSTLTNQCRGQVGDVIYFDTLRQEPQIHHYCIKNDTNGEEATIRCKELTEVYQVLLHLEAHVTIKVIAYHVERSTVVLHLNAHPCNIVVSKLIVEYLERLYLLHNQNMLQNQNEIQEKLSLRGIYRQSQVLRRTRFRSDGDYVLSSHDKLGGQTDLVFDMIIEFLTARDLRCIQSTNKHYRTCANYFRFVPGLRLDLFKHQQHALKWMEIKEGGLWTTGGHGMEDTVHERNPLWVPIDETSWVNMESMEYSNTEPFRRITQGGMLCDEPGLGKTITVLALILRTAGLGAKLGEKLLDHTMDHHVHQIEHAYLNFPEFERTNIKMKIWKEFCSRAMVSRKTANADVNLKWNIERFDQWFHSQVAKDNDKPFRVFVDTVLHEIDQFSSLSYFYPHYLDSLENETLSELKQKSLSFGGEFETAFNNCIEALFNRISLPGRATQMRVSTAEREMLDKLRLTNTGATLIVVPKALLAHWRTQINLHINRQYLLEYAPKNKIFVEDSINVDGKARAVDRRFPSLQELSEYLIVVVSVNYLSRAAGMENHPIRDVRWFRLILDEGHSLGGTISAYGTFLTNLVAKRRWVMTGTPSKETSTQAGVRSLMGIFRFLKLNPFGDAPTGGNRLWRRLILRQMFVNGKRSLEGAFGEENNVVVNMQEVENKNMGNAEVDMGAETEVRSGETNKKIRNDGMKMGGNVDTGNGTTDLVQGCNEQNSAMKLEQNSTSALIQGCNEQNSAMKLEQNDFVHAPQSSNDPTPLEQSNTAHHVQGSNKQKNISPVSNQTKTTKQSILKKHVPTNSTVESIAGLGCHRLIDLLSRVMVRNTKSEVEELPKLIRDEPLRLIMSSQEEKSYNAIVSFVSANIVLTTMGKGGWESSLLNTQNKTYAKEAMKNIRLSCCGGGIMKASISEKNFAETQDLMTRKFGAPKEAIRRVNAFINRAVSGETTTCCGCGLDLMLVLAYPCGHFACSQCVESRSISHMSVKCLECGATFDGNRFAYFQPGFQLEWNDVDLSIPNGGITNVFEDNAQMLQQLQNHSKARHIVTKIETLRTQFQTMNMKIETNQRFSKDIHSDTCGTRINKWSHTKRELKVIVFSQFRRVLNVLGDQLIHYFGQDAVAEFWGSYRDQELHKFVNNEIQWWECPHCGFSNDSVTKKCNRLFLRVRIVNQNAQHNTAEEREIKSDEVLGYFPGQTIRSGQQVRLKTQQGETSAVAIKVTSCTGRRSHNSLKGRKVNCFIMLLSLDGSHGLDLSMVSHVFLLDQIWNPGLEDQVVSRAWRLGAKNPEIHVEQLLMKDTVEDMLNQLGNQRIDKLQFLLKEMKPLKNNSLKEQQKEKKKKKKRKRIMWADQAAEALEN